MKARPIFIAVAAMFSASAIAGGAQQSSAKGASQGAGMEQQSQPQAQNSAQNPEVVKQAQEKLSAAGHDAGTPDGLLGPRTQAALKAFQEKEGLQASGQLDSQTLAALEIGTPEGTPGSSAGASTGSSGQGGSSAGASSEPKARPQPQSGSEQPKSQ